MKKKVSVLIPDGESPGAIKVLRCLSDCSNVDIHILSSEPKAVSRYSRYINSFYGHLELKDPEKWIETINEFTEKYNIDIIIPTYFSGTRRLIEYRQRLSNPEKTLLPSSLKMFDLATDKKELARHMEQHQIPHPKSWTINPSEFSKKQLDLFLYPILLKPTSDKGGGLGIEKFHSSDDLNTLLLSIEHNEEIFLQEFAEGTDLGFNVLCKNGIILAYTIQLGTLFHDQAYKPQIGLKMIKEEKVLESMRKLLKSLNWSGVAHIDLLYDIKTKQFKVLEINPRFWQTLEASSFADVNFPWLYSQAVMGIDFKLPEYKEIEFLTFHGISKKVKNNPFFLFRLHYLWKHSPIKYIIKDPAVFLFLFYQFLKRNFSNQPKTD